MNGVLVLKVVVVLVIVTIPEQNGRLNAFFKNVEKRVFMLYRVETSKRFF